MRYAVYLTFDPVSEEALQRLRRKLAAVVPGVRSVEGKMRPHLTLLVFDDVQELGIMEKFTPLADALHSFTLTLERINIFIGRRHVLYAAPLQSESLQAAYQHYLERFSASSIVPAYTDPARWKPHVTLAKGLDNLALHTARSLAEQAWVPLKATATGVGLINVQKPLDVLASRVWVQPA